MKKIFVSILILNFIWIFSGCPKLVRKKKKETNLPVYFFNDVETVEMNFEIYERNFIFWKTSHDELATCLAETRKKRQACFDYVIDYAERLQTILTVRSSEFIPFFERYGELENSIKAKRLSKPKQELVRKRLDAIRRDFINVFSPNEDVIRNVF